MYLLYAPREKFGIIPPGHSLISEDVKFYQNVAFCAKQYWFKIHTHNGCRDITPRYFKKMREKRVLKTVTMFATGGIGDSMWTMPFARVLKETHPAVAVFIVTEKKNHDIWKYTPYTVSVVENHFWNVLGLVRNSDEVYDFGGIATVLKKEMKLDPIEATFRIGGLPLPKDKERCRPHMIVTIDEGKNAKEMISKEGADPEVDKIITIGVEASTSNRCWPFEYIKALTKDFMVQGYKVIWLGKSPEFSTRFLNEETKKIGVLNFVDRTNLRQAMSLIALSDLYIGPNSGLMVISTAFKIPTIGLFGSFNPKIRAKFYERFMAMTSKVACGPCGEHWTECRNGHPAPCMKQIFPTEVFFAAEDMLKKYPRHILEKLPIE